MSRTKNVRSLTFTQWSTLQYALQHPPIIGRHHVTKRWHIAWFYTDHFLTFACFHSFMIFNDFTLIWWDNLKSIYFQWSNFSYFFGVSWTSYNFEDINVVSVLHRSTAWGKGVIGQVSNCRALCHWVSKKELLNFMNW